MPVKRKNRIVLLFAVRHRKYTLSIVLSIEIVHCILFPCSLNINRIYNNLDIIMVASIENEPNFRMERQEPEERGRLYTTFFCCLFRTIRLLVASSIAPCFAAFLVLFQFNNINTCLVHPTRYERRESAIANHLRRILLHLHPYIIRVKEEKSSIADHRRRIILHPHPYFQPIIEVYASRNPYKTQRNCIARFYPQNFICLRPNLIVF